MVTETNLKSAPSGGTHFTHNVDAGLPASAEPVNRDEPVNQLVWLVSEQSLLLPGVIPALWVLRSYWPSTDHPFRYSEPQDTLGAP